MTQPADLALLAGKMTEAQRQAVRAAKLSAADGAWHPEGYYASADKRVRYALVRHGLIRDYLRPSNRLTPLGLALKSHLQENSNG